MTDIPAKPSPVGLTRRIARAGRLMTWVIRVGAVLVAIGYVYCWSDPRWVIDEIRPQSPFGLSGGQHAALFLVASTVMAVFFYALFQVHAVFSGFARGEIFIYANTMAIKRFGLAILVTVPMQIVAKTLSVLIVTMHNPVGQRELSIAIGGNDYWLIVIGMLILIMGWVMSEAARQAEELGRIV